MKEHINIEELRRGGVVELRGKDSFAIWVKSTCCNLGSRQLRKLADISDKHGRSIVLFTTRQIPMIPFVSLGDVPRVKQELIEVELELDRCGPRVRNLNVCYEDKICPEAVVNCLSLGQKLESFFRNPILRKVKIGVAGCPRDCIISRVLTDVSFVGVKNENGEAFYDVYLGGRLGVNPFVGVKISGSLPEDECVRFLQNYFSFIERESKPGERAADLINRFGEENVRNELNKGLHSGTPLARVDCKFSLNKKEALKKTILRIKATSGELSSDEVRHIAGIAERYGLGFIHFGVRGAPEIPGVAKEELALIGRELGEARLQVLNGGVDNLQTCFGNYCTESLADTQTLLRKIEAKISDLGIDDINITISASGCPNACGIPNVSDLGFHGVVEPEVQPDSCSGCALCVPVCKRKAITMVNGAAIIDKEKCRYCGQCLAVCPVEGVTEKRRGLTVLVGGRGGENTRLGQAIAEFVSPEEALKLAEAGLRLAKERNATLSAIVDEMGVERLKELLTANLGV